MNDIEAYFLFSCEKGLKKRGKNGIKEYEERLKYETTIIRNMGYCGYFLVVSDMLDWALSQRIPVGPGRGCLEGKTSIVTNGGKSVPIQDIKPGDRVFSHLGNLCKVTNIHKYPLKDENLIQIVSYYGDYQGITLTKDHLVFAQHFKETTKYKNAKEKIKKSYKRYLSPNEEIKEIPAGELSPGDWIFTPKPQRIVEENLKEKIDLLLYQKTDEHRVSLKKDSENILIENSLNNISYEHSIKGIRKLTKLSDHFLKKIYYNGILLENNSFGRQKLAIAKFINYLKINDLSIEKWKEYVNEHKFIKKEIPRYIELNNDFFWILGKWIADGWMRKDRNSEWGICSGSHEYAQLERIRKWLKNQKFTYTEKKHKNKNVVQFRICSKLFLTWWKTLFSEYEFSSQTKHFPKFVNSLSNEKLEKIIEGLMDGDGYKENNRERLTTTSYRLANELRYFLASLGIPSSLRINKRTDNRPEWPNESTNFIIDFPKNPLCSYRWAKHSNGYWTQIKSITDIKNIDFVYDLSVEKDKSYLTTSGAVHNSAAGALVSYVLYITHLDPIKYKLIFERFLNPSRISMPDIDLDLDEIRREEVIDYLKNKYGKDNVAHIGTFGKMKAKAAIRDVCRTLGFDYNVGDKLSRLTLDPIAGKPQPLIECYDKVPELKNLRYGEDCPEKTILSWAEKIEDKEKSFGTHASGILISPTPIKEIVPLYPGLNGKATTQYDMNIVDQVGLTKFDLLGLRALTTIDKCINLIYQRKNIRLNSLELPVDDKKTFKTLQRGDTVGLFQLESSGMRDLVVQIRPTKLEDIGVLVAIYRPGPLSSEGFKHYLEVRKGEASPHYLIPELEPILEDTDGFMIYQEQVLEICKQLAGYSLAEADLMRKAIGKKLDKEMNDQEKKFKQGLYNSNISEHIANQLWNDIKAFSDYSFNRAHAICYGFIAYQMAYLKTHYPLEFILSCLITDSNEVDKVIQFISYCKEYNINILGPDINKSEYEFSIDKDDNIRFGLSAIKNMGKPLLDVITERNKRGAFKDIIDFCNRVDLSKINKKKLESLVFAGAFDEISINRAASILAIESVINHKDEIKRYEARLETYNKKLETYNKRLKDIELWDQNKEENKERKIKRPGIIKAPEKPEEPIKPNIQQIKELDVMDMLKKEKELLGYFVSQHPLDFVKEKTDHNIKSIKECVNNFIIKSGTKLSIIAIPSLIKEITTKTSKQKMAYANLEDKTGTIQSIIFPRALAENGQYINISVPAEYYGEIEITDGEIDKIIKFKVSKVIPLKSIILENKEIDFCLTSDKLIEAADYFFKEKGNTKINFSYLTKGNNKITFGKFSSGRNREEVLSYKKA